MTPKVYDFIQGSSPLLISVPHAGTSIPAEIASQFTSHALTVPDTDWQVDHLYRWSLELGVGMLRANFCRYVVDLNRSIDDQPLYQSKSTGLFPQITFAEQPIYIDDTVLTSDQRRQRISVYWQPYHQQLIAELRRLRERFGYALLLDAHSIAPRLPMLFQGRLPDFNLGSNSGAAAHQSLIQAAWAALSGHDNYSAALDGRFKGGYITRHYGQPRQGMHALQLELSQAVYWGSAAQRLQRDRLLSLQPVLQQLVDSLLNWRP